MSNITDGLRTAVIGIEQNVAEYVGNEVEAMRKLGGDKLANELLASVACLFAARSAAILHVWTGDKTDSVRRRIFETFDQDFQVSLEKILASISKPTT